MNCIQILYNKTDIISIFYKYEIIRFHIYNYLTFRKIK